MTIETLILLLIIVVCIAVVSFKFLKGKIQNKIMLYSSVASITIVVGLVSLFAISLYINYGQYNQPEKLSPNDFSISNFKYKSDFPSSDPLWISLPDKTLAAQASLVITANKGNTYFEVYDAYNNSLVLGSLFAANPGDNEVRISGIKLFSLNQQPQIKVCVVANSAFNIGKSLSENPNAVWVLT